MTEYKATYLLDENQEKELAEITAKYNERYNRNDTLAQMFNTMMICGCNTDINRRIEYMKGVL